MATGGGILTQLLMGHAQRKREGELIDLADKKRKQETQGKFFLQEADNPGIADPDRQGLRQLAIESMSTPLKAYDSAKFGKRYSDIMLGSHDRQVGVADQNAAQTPEPITFQIPQGLLGNSMPPAPPPGQQALPSDSGFPQGPPLRPPGVPPPPAQIQTANGPAMLNTGENSFIDRLRQFGYLPPGLPAGAPPQMQGSAAPNPAGTPGMLTQTGMEGLHAPGSNVPGVVRPFVDPLRAAATASRIMEAGAPGDYAKAYATTGGTATATQQAQLAGGRERLKVMEPYIQSIEKDNPAMADMMRMEALTGGNPGNLFAPLMAASVAAPTRIPVDVTGMPKEQKAQYGIPPEATGKYTIMMDRFLNPVGAFQGWEGTTITTNAAGETGIVNKANPNVVTPLTAVGGGPAINPAMQPTTSTSVQNIPGLPPVTTNTQRRKGTTLIPRGPNTVPPQSSVPPNPPTGGGTNATATPTGRKISDAFPQGIKDWAIAAFKGDRDFPTDKNTLAAVNQYGSDHQLTAPIKYPPAVQDALAKNMTSLDQINQLMTILRPYKDDTAVFTSAPAALAYKFGYTDPKKQLGELIGKVSVTDILAAGRVLGTAGIRSNRFNYNDALTHTPDPSKDSGATMYGKLNWMKQLIEDQNKNSLKYQRKSGVIPTGGGGASTGGKPPTTAQEYLDSIGH